MPRTARAIQAGLIYHVLNRGNGRMRLFHDEQDYAAFEGVLAEGLQRYPVDLLTYCLMPNHWHLVLRGRTDAAIGRLLGWVGVTHVRRHHARYHSRSTGHLYQGRFKSFPVEDGYDFLTLCRYVEANAKRAKLVPRAEQWVWGGLWRRLAGNWLSLVNRALESKTLAGLQACVNRGQPWGSPEWVQATTVRLGLEYSFRGAGRPRKPNKEARDGKMRDMSDVPPSPSHLHPPAAMSADDSSDFPSAPGHFLTPSSNSWPARQLPPLPAPYPSPLVPVSSPQPQVTVSLLLDGGVRCAASAIDRSAQEGGRRRHRRTPDAYHGKDHCCRGR